MDLVLKDVGFSYDRGLPTEKAVLRSVSLTAKSGELVSVVGRTGSGKTTLGLIMAGLMKPQSGEVFVTGRGASQPEAGARRLNAVMVFQVPESQFFEEDVFGEVAFGPSKLGVRHEELPSRVFSSLSRLGLDAARISLRSPTRLSEGEKRKVAIASALSCEPRFLILDEPTISLDWLASKHLFSLLRVLADDGVAVIVLTHEVGSAARFSDRLGVLSQGAVVASGKLEAEEVFDIWQQGQSVV
jgi:energy-coupling factor transport system ATP-binding protein